MPAGQFSASDLPAWVRDPTERFLHRAERISMEPHVHYNLPRVAQIPPDIRAAHHLVRGRHGEHRRHLEGAGRGIESALRPFSENYQQYMNPFQRAVLDEIAKEGQQTFRERILPELESRFIRAGQHGSRHHREMATRGARDVQSQILAKQAQALSHGYQQAAQIYNAEMARRLEGANARATLAGLQQAGLAAEAGMLGEQGRYQQQQEQAALDTAYQEFLRQQAYPQQQLGVLGAALAGTPSPAVVQSWAQNAPVPTTNVAGQIGQAGLQALGALLAARK